MGRGCQQVHPRKQRTQELDSDLRSRNHTIPHPDSGRTVGKFPREDGHMTSTWPMSMFHPPWPP